MSRATSADREYFQKQVALYKALAHPVRLQILEVVGEDEACVCHLEAVIGKRQSYISQQVSVLKQAGLLAERRKGQFIYYRLANRDLERVIVAGGNLLQDEGDLDQERMDYRSSGDQLAVEECPCPRCKVKEDRADR
jgi:ArsR family transcriptional regulator